MTLAQALPLGRRRDSRFVLLMGEPGTGKTAMMATLWERLSAGEALAGHRLAGTRTALGFERRAHWGRPTPGSAAAASRAPPWRTPSCWTCAFADPTASWSSCCSPISAAAVFEHVRQGRPLLQELPWAMRADRFVVALDAQALSVPGESEIAATRALRQLLALRSSGAVRATARVAIALTKADALTESGERALARHQPNLLANAAAVDPEPANVRIAVAAAG